ncbi:MAG TPA: prolyl aminopeptidase [Rhodanobacteraceae bacterium]|nr:prolyl aminopeptidase [Rhodanobacteraceae bacterium]
MAASGLPSRARTLDWTIMDRNAPFARQDLFAPIEPYATGTLKLDPIHTMYWEQSGRPDGAPILFLHGGPGAGSTATHRRFFDPSHYRIVVFDQRGAGRSTPLGSLQSNTTAHLIADIEALRQHLGIERWALFGGSWGSTLSLAYAEAHPARCRGLVLRGIFLAGAAEIDWFMHGARHFFPEAWRAFVEFLPEDERDDILASYHLRLTSPDPAVHLPAAGAWDRYEIACSSLMPQSDAPAPPSEHASLAIARIEAHYFVHRAFLVEDELLGNLHRIRHLPATIVQGRYDVVCPPVSADALASAWPEAELVMVPDAGHSVREPGIARALVAAVERLRARLS